MRPPPQRVSFSQHTESTLAVITRSKRNGCNVKGNNLVGGWGTGVGPIEIEITVMKTPKRKGRKEGIGGGVGGVTHSK